MIKNCENCCYYKRTFSGISACIRFPPIPIQKFKGFFRVETEFDFPTVRKSDICGEWRHKETDWLEFPPKEA